MRERGERVMDEGHGEREMKGGRGGDIIKHPPDNDMIYGMGMMED